LDGNFSYPASLHKSRYVKDVISERCSWIGTVAPASAQSMERTRYAKYREGEL